MADDPDVIAWRSASSSVAGWKARKESINTEIQNGGRSGSFEALRDEAAEADFNIEHWTAEWTRLDKIVDDKRIRLSQEEGR